MNRKKYGFIFLGLSFFFLLTSCDEEFVPEVFKPRTDHEAYRHSLEKTDLLTTALGRDWLEADKRSLENPVVIQLPYQEAFYFAPQIPEANGYVFSVKRGQKIQIKSDCLLTSFGLIPMKAAPDNMWPQLIAGNLLWVLNQGKMPDII